MQGIAGRRGPDKPLLDGGRKDPTRRARCGEGSGSHHECVGERVQPAVRMPVDAVEVLDPVQANRNGTSRARLRSAGHEQVDRGTVPTGESVGACGGETGQQGTRSAMNLSYRPALIVGQGAVVHDDREPRALPSPG